MYTTYIGKKFLKIFNRYHNTNISAEIFFDIHFFELFFRDDSHLMHIGNSPFFQKPLPSRIRKYGSKSLAQLAELKYKIENDPPNFSIYVGSWAKDINSTTSGQTTNKSIIDKEDIYSSWIGQALSICVNGGMNLLLDQEKILWILFKGWQHYRSFLIDIPKIKDKQIETWNGQWLHYCLISNFQFDHPEHRLNIEIENFQGKNMIPTIKWSKVILALSKKFRNEKLCSYVYNLSQTNTTIGFITIHLKEIRRLFEVANLYSQEFGSKISDQCLLNFETSYNFKDACTLGIIGLRAIKPAFLSEFYSRRKYSLQPSQEIDLKNEKNQINYTLTLIWIYAMLDKKEIIDLTGQFALAIINLKKIGSKGKLKGNSIEDVSKKILTSNDILEFIANTTLLLTHDNAYDLNRFIEKLHMEVSDEQFPLFLTLLNFKYQYYAQKS